MKSKGTKICFPSDFKIGEIFFPHANLFNQNLFYKEFLPEQVFDWNFFRFQAKAHKMLIKFPNLTIHAKCGWQKAKVFSKGFINMLKSMLLKLLLPKPTTTLFCRLFHHATSFNSRISVCFISHYFVATPNQKVCLDIIAFQFQNETKKMLIFSPTQLFLANFGQNCSAFLYNTRVLCLQKSQYNKFNKVQL